MAPFFFKTRALLSSNSSKFGAIAAISTFPLGFALNDGEKKAFSPKEWRSFKLIQVRELTHDTSLFRFALPTTQHEMGMKTSSCIMVQGETRTGSMVARPYTPTSTNEQKGFFDLIVKNYPNGNVSSYIHGLKIGDNLNVKGPYMKLEYKPNMFKRIGMIAGGSGITPMIQLCREILSNPDDTTEISLVFANNTEGDIMQKAWLDQMAAQYHNFRVYYTVRDAPAGWRQGQGVCDAEMIEKKMPAPEAGTMVFVCGPDGMMDAVCGPKGKNYTQGELQGLLKERGFTAEQVYKF
mmetsp:Transcript_67343/g.154302  ORF Transcript_67343/g.154302 Transcript_67343/m.154302 type:complete len:294 (-) Transcript_67343:297-1178(-)